MGESFVRLDRGLYGFIHISFNEQQEAYFFCLIFFLSFLRVWGLRSFAHGRATVAGYGICKRLHLQQSSIEEGFVLGVGGNMLKLPDHYRIQCVFAFGWQSSSDDEMLGGVNVTGTSNMGFGRPVIISSAA